MIEITGTKAAKSEKIFAYFVWLADSCNSFHSQRWSELRLHFPGTYFEHRNRSRLLWETVSTEWAEGWQAFMNPPQPSPGQWRQSLKERGSYTHNSFDQDGYRALVRKHCMASLPELDFPTYGEKLRFLQSLHWGYFTNSEMLWAAKEAFPELEFREYYQYDSGSSPEPIQGFDLIGSRVNPGNMYRCSSVSGVFVRERP